MESSQWLWAHLLAAQPPHLKESFFLNKNILQAEKERNGVFRMKGNGRWAGRELGAHSRAERCAAGEAAQLGGAVCFVGASPGWTRQP